jgi:hypothetical protein
MPDSFGNAWAKFRRAHSIEFVSNIVERSLLSRGPRMQLEPDRSQQRQKLHRTNFHQRATFEFRNEQRTDAGCLRDFALREPAGNPRTPEGVGKLRQVHK